MPVLADKEIAQLNSLTPEQAAKAWAYLRKLSVKANPFLLIDDGLLKIKTKSGDLVTLTMNKAQLKLFLMIKKLWAEGKIIRIIILKARQLGISTFIEALIYSITSQLDNQNSVIIADDKSGSNYIFEMSKLYQETCPPYLRPEVKRSNEKKLEFEGNHSQILIDTAENQDAGRKFTFRSVHLSEVAFFNKNNYEAIMLGLSHSVPSLPRTIIIKETTANGFNFFKDDWDATVRGENDYIPVFIPWYWGEDYKMPADDNFLLGDKAFGDISRDEPELYEQMQTEEITDILQRLNWRRWDIRNNCGGDVEKFHQENPSTDIEAFIATGRCYFHQKNLVKQLKTSNKPLFKANIVKENFKFVLRKCDDGDFTFYKEPSIHAQYCIGGDACSGSGADWSPLVALDKGTNEVVCVYRTKSDPDELAFRAMMLGNLLNQCVVAIENDKFGFAANQKLRTIYGNVYVQRTHDKVENKIVEKIGWETNAVTRPLMLGQLQEEIREGSARLNDHVLIRECLTFIQNPDTKKAEAELGCNDDMVIARAIAGMLRVEVPYKHKPDRPTIFEQRTGNAGLRFGRK